MSTGLEYPPKTKNKLISLKFFPKFYVNICLDLNIHICIYNIFNTFIVDNITRDCYEKLNLFRGFLIIPFAKFILSGQ